MGDINSKNIDSLQESTVLRSLLPDSNKNNIILMNPVIQLRSNDTNASTGNSTETSNGDSRIEKLLQELKRKQEEIDRERQLWKLAEQRCKDKIVRSEKRLREKDDQIFEQNIMLSQQSEMLFEYQAYLEEEQFYHRGEKRICVESGFADDIQITNQSQWVDFSNCQTSQVFTKGNTVSYSKNMEQSCEKDPVQLWQWNGTNWTMVVSNKITPTDNQISSFNPEEGGRQSRNGKEPTSRTEENRVPLTREIREESQVIGPYQRSLQPGGQDRESRKDNEPNSRTEESRVPLTKEIREESQVIGPHERKSSSPVDKSNVRQNDQMRHVFYFDHSTEQISELNFTALSYPCYPHTTELSMPSNVSISFDDQELARYMHNDDGLFRKPTRVRSSR